MAGLKVQLKITDPRLGRDFPLPDYATPGSAGMDLRAMEAEDFILEPGQCRLISCGFNMYIGDPGICAVVIPRSGLGYKNGIVLGNLTGLIDSDYQGPLMVPLWNRSNEPFKVEAGARIAQVVFVPVIKAEFNVVTAFEAGGIRGEGGYGSTGTA